MVFQTVGELIEYLLQFSSDTKISVDNLRGGVDVDYDEDTDTVDFH